MKLARIVVLSKLVVRVPNAKPGRESTDIEIYGMQGIPPNVLAAHYGEEEDEAPSKLAKVEIPPGSLGIGFPQSTLGSMPPVYNSALVVPPAGWPVPPRPQLWFPQRPAVSVPTAPMGLVQQPLFPVQNVRPPVQPATSLALQPSLPTAPPRLPPATPVPLSQPLFPVVANNNIPTQSSPFSAPMLSTIIQLSSPMELKNSIDMINNASVASNYHIPGIQGGTPVNSHSYASGPNTGGPSIGLPPVIANRAPATS